MHAIYSNPLPSGWLEEPLGRLVTTKRGCTWSKEQERDRPDADTIPVIRIPNIQASLDLTDLLHIQGVSANQRSASAVTKGWTLMVGSNGNPKRIGDSVLMEVDREMIFASFLFALRPKPDEDKVSDEFIACWLHAHRVHEFVSETSQMTTGLANISWSAYRKLPVRFPKDAAEQTRIAETLKAADDHIRALEEQLRAAERVKKAIVEQGTTIGLGANTKTKHTKRYGYEFATNTAWNQVELRTLKPLIDYGTNQSSNDQQAGSSVIAIPQVLNSRFALGELPFAEVPDRERDSLALKPHDVLVVRTNGNPSYIGRSTVIPEGVLDRVTIFASYLIRIRLDETRLRGAFLNYVLLSQTGRRQSTCLANTSAGNFNLGARSLSKFLIPLPTPEEQDEIIEAINAADDLVLDLQRQLTAGRRVKQSLLQNLLTGKIHLKT
ncbi:MAG: restriction endonuclease subunit S [Verrucomicrobia bacterium]|nr:restriction endonuclease subunit S [Verrucomicrobiota bacterium]